MRSATSPVAMLQSNIQSPQLPQVQQLPNILASQTENPHDGPHIVSQNAPHGIPAPNIRSAERYIPRNTTQSPRQREASQPQVRAPEPPRTVPYEAGPVSVQNDSTHPINSQWGESRPTLHKALCDLNAWPPRATKVLQDLILRRLDQAFSTSHLDPAITVPMFREFQDRLAVWFTVVPAESKLLHSLFLQKLRELLTQRGKTISGSEQNSRSDNIHTPNGQANAPASKRAVSVIQTSTPPQTPVIAGAEGDALLAYWSNASAEKQITLFRELLQSAKDPKGLSSEWEAYRFRSQQGKQAEEVHRRALSHSAEQTQAATPVYTPPTDSRLDLNAIIEARIKNARLKRQREDSVTNQQDAEINAGNERSVKKVNTGSMVLSP